MTRDQVKDEIARWRYEIKHSRECNRRMRLAMRALSERPMGQRDPIQSLHLRMAINERLALIRDRQRAIENAKVYL